MVVIANVAFSCLSPSLSHCTPTSNTVLETVMLVKFWPWDIAVPGKCFRFEPRVNGICLMDRTPLGGHVYCTWVGIMPFFLLECVQRCCCVSTLFLSWINRWHWVSHCSDAIDFITWVKPLGDSCAMSLSPCVYDKHRAEVLFRRR